MRLCAGIGSAIVKRFHTDGSRVVIADVDDAAGQALASELGERAMFVHCDVTYGLWSSLSRCQLKLCACARVLYAVRVAVEIHSCMLEQHAGPPGREILHSEVE